MDQLRFAVIAVDIVAFTIKENELFVRTITVDRPPHFDHVPGLPGGLIRPSETAEEAAARHLKDKAEIDPEKVHIEQLYTFSSVDRDPRGRVVAVAYLALVPWTELSSEERHETGPTKWVRVQDARKLAYDHDEMLAVGLARLRSRVTYTTLIGKLVPDEFTLTELEQAYECILKTDLDKRNFRKKILKTKVLKELPHKRSGGRFRPAQLYSFSSKKIEEIQAI